jgi:hypothetical protein
VWGLAPSSVGRNSYYVSFIHDFSKFTWIYLLRHKSEVFAKFHLFQQHVERLLNKKIIAIQTNWGGEYEKLIFFHSDWDLPSSVVSPYTPTKWCCKHTHIVEVCLSLLSKASMPLKFWDEAYLIGTLLINHTPS